MRSIALVVHLQQVKLPLPKSLKHLHDELTRYFRQNHLRQRKKLLLTHEGGRYR